MAGQLVLFAIIVAIFAFLVLGVGQTKMVNDCHAEWNDRVSLSATVTNTTGENATLGVYYTIDGHDAGDSTRNVLAPSSKNFDPGETHTFQSSVDVPDWLPSLEGHDVFVNVEDMDGRVLAWSKCGSF